MNGRAVAGKRQLYNNDFVFTEEQNSFGDKQYKLWLKGRGMSLWSGYYAVM